MGIRRRNRKKKGQKKTVFDAEVYVRGERIAFRTFETRGQAEEWYEQTKTRFESGKVPDTLAERMSVFQMYLSSTRRSEFLNFAAQLGKRRKYALNT